MPRISTHVLDGEAGGPVPGVNVELRDRDKNTVAKATTDDRGRIETLADGLAPGPYEIVWRLGGFVVSLSATLDLSEERHYHVPVLASGHSAVVYLGA
jgi:5-hydroxyisourate hydrolase-like protein (transthyretin family)